MAVSARLYTNGPKHIASDVSWSDNAGTTIKVLLCTSAYVPDQDNHEFKSSVTGEVVGAGYTAGGIALTGRSITSDAASNETRLLSTLNPQWTNASFTARYAVVYKDTGTPGTSALLGYIDFGGDSTVSTAPFSITWDPTGVAKLTAA